MLREKVKELCKRKGVSLSRVERECGFAKGYLSKLEGSTPNAKTSIPNAKKLQVLADYFGVSLDYLLSNTEQEHYYLDPETAKIAQQLFENADLRILFDAAKNSKPEDLRIAAELLTRLKGANADA